MIQTQGSDISMNANASYRHEQVVLTFQAARKEMAFGYLGWMIQGWLNLMGIYGWWEEKVELMDRQLGLLAVGMIGTATAA